MLLINVIFSLQNTLTLELPYDPARPLLGTYPI